MATNRSRRSRRSWHDLSRSQKRLTVIAGAVEVVLTTIAARDLAARPASQVRGPKALWVPLLAVQPLGPVAYLLVGRRR
jgi:hypothetical protein